MFAPASPQVAWERISRFVLNEVTAPREALPARTTLAWARRTALALLDEAEADGAPPAGLVQFVGDFMLGSLDPDSPMWPFPAAWAAELVPRNAVLGNLLAARAGLGENGIFTDKAFNITYQTPSLRGARLSQRLFCGVIPPHPEGVPLTSEPAGPGQTRREVLEAAMINPACTACHRIIDPLGFSLENYDAAGEYRTIDNSRPVDASGTYTAPSGQVFNFTSMADLAPKLAESCDVAECFARTLFDDALARAEAPVAPSTYSELELLRVAAPFMSSGFSIRVLIGEIVTAPSFLGE